jgi:hypothetical protein
MEIDEYEAGMLDAVLQAFAGRAHLDWTELMELFDGDEELAAAITDILAGMEMVIKSGEETKSGLPEKIFSTDDVAAFIEKGGFTAQVKAAKQQPVVQQALTDPVKEQAPPNREIVFEIENNLQEEPLVEVESAPEPKPQPILPAETERPAVEDVKAAPNTLLEQEIAHLRLEQRRFEHQLREKDINIQNLTVQNEMLGRFRIFIWVLLGLIALLIAGLLLRK